MNASIKINGTMAERFDEILTPGALQFLTELHQRFNPRRKELLQQRIERQAEIDAGKLPDFLPETAHIREGNWTVAPLPQDLLDRRVEITGPVNRKMIINALNCGANLFMADFEDANSPLWTNCIHGQINLKDAVRRTITFTNPSTNKFYELNEKIAVLKARPRGWHLEEKHMTFEGKNLSGSLVDFGLYFFHNAKELLERSSGPYFYLPKLESHLEARLWNDVFVFAQDYIGIEQGSIKATVLIETILATFEADEILYELREHSSGLNCGRWDYIFSYIKKLKKHQDYILPDRAQVTMGVPFMKNYSEYVIKTCHKRNVHGMGGMAAQIPIKNNPEANKKALKKVALDKEREAKAGHDGTWVAHPGLVAIAKEQFDKYMPQPNQIDKKREDVNVTSADLLAIPEGTITKEGLKTNIDIAIQYIEAWLNGMGSVPIYNLMEDAATAEISRAQVWQWIHNPNAKLEDGTPITYELYQDTIPEVMEHIRNLVGSKRFEHRKYQQALGIFEDLVSTEHFEEFLTLPAYEQID